MFTICGSKQSILWKCVSMNVTVRGCDRGKRKLRDEVKRLRHSADLQNTHHGRKSESTEVRMREWTEGKEVRTEKEVLPGDAEGKNSLSICIPAVLEEKPLLFLF